MGTEITSLSKDLPSALKLNWEAKWEEARVLLLPQPCCMQGIAPGPLSCQSFLQLLSTASLPCLPKATREHDVNIINITKDPEEHKLPQRHRLKKKKVIPYSYSD